MHVIATLQALTLISAANMAPVVAKRIFGSRLAQPIDRGILMRDKRPLLGRSKTWRGVLAGCIAPALVAPLLHIPIAVGVIGGAAAMTGDGASSFIKRRMGLAPSDKATGLDQIPEALLSALALCLYLPLSATDVIGVVTMFFVGEIVLSRLFFAMGLRDRPY